MCVCVYTVLHPKSIGSLISCSNCDHIPRESVVSYFIRTFSFSSSLPTLYRFFILYPFSYILPSSSCFLSLLPCFFFFYSARLLISIFFLLFIALHQFLDVISIFHYRKVYIFFFILLVNWL